MLHDRFRDAAAVRAHYATAKAWVEGCRALLDEHDVISTGQQLGDWLDPAAPPDRPQDARTDPYLVATAYLAHSAHLLAEQAELVGAAADAGEYAELAARVTRGFQREFTTRSGRLSSDSQTANALALRFDLFADDEQRRGAGRRLGQPVREAQARIGTGFAGTPVVLDALTEVGDLEAAYRLLLEQQCPSWLYPVTMGATTMWERWDSMLPDGTINPGGMTSFNHYALGAAAEWMHRVVAGLAPAAPGYRRLSVRPRPGGGLTSASARHLTPYGPAEVSWTRDEAHLRVEVLVPPNTDAVVELPAADRQIVGSGLHTFVVEHAPASQDPIQPLPSPTKF